MIGKIPESRLSLWKVDDRARALAEKIPSSPLIALLLQMRGISEENISEARTWLRPGLDDSLAGLFLGSSSKEAASLWRRMRGAERVVIYGDYDVDGASSTTLAMELALQSFREVRYFIPHRHKEGYGVHDNVVRNIAKNGCDLLIAVDCGTRDIVALRTAREAGIPVIIFDHHAAGEALPDGVILVNPQAGGDDASRTLCATGVLWAWAYLENIASREWLSERTDLVALATLADHVPLGGLNRGLVSRGIDMIRLSKRRGLGALFNAIGIEPQDVDEESLVMKVVPCLNAAGRMGLADISVEVMLGGGGLEQKTRELVRLNNKRRSVSEEILEDVLPSISSGESRVLSDFSWPVGVLSGVASRVCSETGQPVALASLSGDHVRGTLRVPSGCDALDVLNSIGPDLLSWGGHRFAAGFSVSIETWEGAKRKIEEKLFSLKPVRDHVRAIEISPMDLSEDDVISMAQLGPFGSGNPGPVFFTCLPGRISLQPLGRDGKHLKVHTAEGDFLAFGGVPLSESIIDSRGWTFRPRINRWRGRSRVDLVMESIVVGN